jgi:hypothetical protein
MFIKNDPLLGAINETIRQTQLKLDVEKALNENLGIQDKRVLPREFLDLYLKTLNESLSASIKENKVVVQIDEEARDKLGTYGSFDEAKTYNMASLMPKMNRRRRKAALEAGRKEAESKYNDEGGVDSEREKAKKEQPDKAKYMEEAIERQKKKENKNIKEESLNEVSKKLLGNYIKQATMDKVSRNVNIAHNFGDKGNSEKYKKLKIRTRGIHRAIDKLSGSGNAKVPGSVNEEHKRVPGEGNWLVQHHRDGYGWIDHSLHLTKAKAQNQRDILTKHSTSNITRIVSAPGRKSVTLKDLSRGALDSARQDPGRNDSKITKTWDFGPEYTKHVSKENSKTNRFIDQFRKKLDEGDLESATPFDKKKTDIPGKDEIGNSVSTMGQAQADTVNRFTANPESLKTNLTGPSQGFPDKNPTSDAPIEVKQDKTTPYKKDITASSVESRTPGAETSTEPKLVGKPTGGLPKPTVPVPGDNSPDKIVPAHWKFPTPPGARNTRGIPSNETQPPTSAADSKGISTGRASPTLQRTQTRPAPQRAAAPRPQTGRIKEPLYFKYAQGES